MWMDHTLNTVEKINAKRKKFDGIQCSPKPSEIKLNRIQHSQFTTSNRSIDKGTNFAFSIGNEMIVCQVPECKIIPHSIFMGRLEIVGTLCVWNLLNEKEMENKTWNCLSE